jgi:hypothetical protein
MTDLLKEYWGFAVIAGAVMGSFVAYNLVTMFDGILSSLNQVAF